VTWASVEIEEVAIAQGEAKDAGGQVLEGRLAATYRDDVHDPVLAPDVPGELLESRVGRRQ